MITNVIQFILGYINFGVYTYIPKLLPRYIRDQFYRRLHHRSCQNECVYECNGCGCKIPQVLFAPKGCKKYTYPPLMFRKSKWEEFAQAIHDFEIKSIENVKSLFKIDFPEFDEDLIQYLITRSFYGDSYRINPVIFSVIRTGRIDKNGERCDYVEPDYNGELDVPTIEFENGVPQIELANHSFEVDANTFKQIMDLNPELFTSIRIGTDAAAKSIRYVKIRFSHLNKVKLP